MSRIKWQVLEFGAMSLNKDRICFFILNDFGKQGIKENKNKNPAGNAINKLNEMEDARSYNPSVFNWLNKNLIT